MTLERHADSAALTTRDGADAGGAARRPDIVIVGAASRDVDASDPRGWRLGGSATYGALVAARLGARVGALIGVDAPAAAEGHELDLLRLAGADIELVPLERGPVFENRETGRGREQVGLQPSDRLPPEALPHAWSDAGAFLLAPVADELPDRWADVPPVEALVALGWQGVLRRIVAGERVRPVPAVSRPLMTRSDVSSVSTEDLAAGGDRLDRLLPRAGQQLMVTASAHGALHVRRTAGGVAFRRVPAVSARTVADTTGAGDSFHTAWVLSQLPGGPFGRDPLPVGRGLHLAAIVGALAVEGHGLAGLPDRAAVARRIADLR